MGFGAALAISAEIVIFDFLPTPPRPCPPSFPSQLPQITPILYFYLFFSHLDSSWGAAAITRAASSTPTLLEQILVPPLLHASPWAHSLLFLDFSSFNYKSLSYFINFCCFLLALSLSFAHFLHSPFVSSPSSISSYSPLFLALLH